MARVAAATSSTDLLERAAELAALAESLDAVREGSRGRIVFVGGEAGVGKTVLLRRFCEERGGSVRILWGACDPLFAPRPLGPLLTMADDVGGELEEVVGSEAVPHEVATALARELQARVPTMLVLEDVHWADEATLDVLRLLARKVETVPALIVASYRDDELDRSHPLRLLLGELATSSATRRLKLAPLSPEAVAQLAKLHDVDAKELFEKTSGNPFFVVEALATGAEEIPETVRDAVLARVARLSPEARTLLEAVAVVPPQAELWLLEALVPEVVDRLEECLTSGMLAAGPGGVAFRHELARLAVEESVAPDRKLDLHRKALAALAQPPGGAPDLARLAHHAEAAGDIDAVVRFAPAAAVRAASLGARREAAAQYARALRFGGGLRPSRRAELLEDLAGHCFVTDQYDDGIAALEEALELRRWLGDRLREGDALRRLSEFLWCPGRTNECQRAAREAVAVLEPLPASHELASAYANLAAVCISALRTEEAEMWAGLARKLAERVGDTSTAISARVTLSRCHGDADALEECFGDARRAGLADTVGWLYSPLAFTALAARRLPVASRYLDEGLAYCGERGIELVRLYLLADRARLELYQGRWSEAADTASIVLGIPRTSTTPRIVADSVLGLIRARRGDPDAWTPLDEAWRLAEPTSELPRVGTAAAGRAEAAWLEGDRDRVAEATEAALALALELGAGSFVGELETWRLRAGLEPTVSDLPAGALPPHQAQLSGDWARAAESWTALGCPYEAALALADSDEEEPLRRALAEFQALGAGRPAAIVAGRLRERGVRGLPRGPRRATRGNPAGLTTRELEVLALLAEGLRNAEIAAQLVVSPRTVDHQVSAILRKLGVRTRAQAGAEAVRLGLTGQDR